MEKNLGVEMNKRGIKEWQAKESNRKIIILNFAFTI